MNGLGTPLQVMAECAAPHLLRAMNEVGSQDLFLVAKHSETRMCWVFLPLADSKPLLLSQNMGSQIKLATFIVLYFTAERSVFSKVKM